jgi:hypothetical protein
VRGDDELVGMCRFLGQPELRERAALCLGAGLRQARATRVRSLVVTWLCRCRDDALRRSSIAPRPVRCDLASSVRRGSWRPASAGCGYLLGCVTNYRDPVLPVGVPGRPGAVAGWSHAGCPFAARDLRASDDFDWQNRKSQRSAKIRTGAHEFRAKACPRSRLIVRRVGQESRPSARAPGGAGVTARLRGWAALRPAVLAGGCMQ